jgi:hypothetical protein
MSFMRAKETAGMLGSIVRDFSRHIYAHRSVRLGYAGRIYVRELCFSSKLPVSIPSLWESGIFYGRVLLRAPEILSFFFWRSVLDAFFRTGLIVYLSLHCLKIEPFIRDTPAYQFPSFRWIMNQRV